MLGGFVGGLSLLARLAAGLAGGGRELGLVEPCRRRHAQLGAVRNQAGAARIVDAILADPAWLTPARYFLARETLRLLPRTTDATTAAAVRQLAIDVAVKEVVRRQAVSWLGSPSGLVELVRPMTARLLGYEFNGKVFPVNPQAEVISSMKVYRTVLQIYDDIDLAIIVVPKQYVPQALEDCGRRGIGGVIVISAGFREVGKEGLKLERQIQKLQKKYDGMRIVGPNSLPESIPAAGRPICSSRLRAW